MGMTIIPKVKEERILNGTAVIHRVHWLFPEETEDRLRSAAQALFPDDPAGYPVRVSLLDTESQAYRLRILPEGAEVEADCAAAAFYAMQSLAMLHRLYAGTIPCREISDAPGLPFRGFMLDVTRGRVPTMSSLKAIVRQLARYKINKLQIYIENAFPFEQMAGITAPENPAVSDLLLAVEGTRHTAAMLQSILYGADCFDASWMHSWFTRYQAGWLRENKPSELWRLRQFLRDAEHKCRVAHNG